MGTYTGNGGANVLKGGSGDDTFKGFGGADTIYGGSGIDIALYGDSPTGVGITLAGHAGYGGSAEGDVLYGIENLGGSAWDDILAGDESPNTFYGNGGNDALKGFGGGDTLNGNMGDDTLNGGLGYDDLYGGTGNDTYVINDGVDAIHEYAGEGIDEVVVGAHYNLTAGADIEVLRTADPSSTAWIDLRGNSSGNVIIGNNGDSHITGLGGHDYLTGGGGDDFFHFAVAPSADNLTVITDFNAWDDRIVLHPSYFPALGPNITFDEFVIGPAAQDGNDHLIYNNVTGAVLYDPDGSGGMAAIHFVTLPVNSPLFYNDFLIDS